MDRRGTGAENSINRINRLLKERDIPETESEVTEDRIAYSGEVKSVIPDETFIPMKNHEPDLPDSEETGSILSDAELLAALDGQYRILFGEGGYEILEEASEGSSRLDPDEIGTEDYQGTAQLMVSQGLIAPRSGAPTDLGEATYSNWSKFEDYLVSDQRIESIEQDFGQENMPRFMESFGIETDLDSFLSNRQGHWRRWRMEHDERVEMYNISEALYSTDEEFGFRLVELEAAKNGDIRSPETLSGAGIRGLIDREGLNQDGERLYRKARTDYVWNS